jgi:hypothetical protein
MAFESLTSAELTLLRDETLAAYRKAINATSYGIGSRNLTRAQPAQLLQLLSEISHEIAHRSDQTGGIGVVEIGDTPSP